MTDYANARFIVRLYSVDAMTTHILGLHISGLVYPHFLNHLKWNLSPPCSAEKLSGYAKTMSF